MLIQMQFLITIIILILATLTKFVSKNFVILLPNVLKFTMQMQIIDNTNVNVINEF